MISLAERKPYMLLPKVQCGVANSASIGHRPSVRWRSRHRRYRFHQPLRSETKCSRLSGDHSGWQMDSSAPPAMRLGADSVPSSLKSASQSVVPCHGMRGWSQLSQASERPSGDKRGDE
jgi:hypothetical protein